MPCPRCDQTPCKCLTLEKLLGTDGVGTNILSNFSLQGLFPLLNTSRTTRDSTRSHIQEQVRIGRNQIVNLFDDGKPLHDLFLHCKASVPDDIELWSNPFEEASTPVFRTGWYLTHVAVAIKNTCNDMCWAKWGRKLGKTELGVIVVTTLVLHQGQRILIVALNGGSNRVRKVFAEFCTGGTFQLTIGVHATHVVHNADPPHQNLVTLFEEQVVTSEAALFQQWLKDAHAHHGRDWHGEQKILQYVEHTFGFEVRKFVLCLGISHLSGPCQDGTRGTQHCGRYLNALRLLDIAFLGQAGRFVMGFWFQGGDEDRQKNPIYKICFKDFN